MLTKKEHRFLKAAANQLKARYQIGKNDVGPSQISLIDNALTARELIKVSLLKTVEGTTQEVAMLIATKTNSDIIETKGRTFVLYRRNTKDPKIKLPQ